MALEEKITLVFLAASLALCSFFGVRFFVNSGEYFFFFVAMLLPVFVGASLVGWLFFKFPNPFSAENLKVLARALLFLFLGFYAYSHMKVLAPLVNQMNFDNFFLELDRMLFGGISPTLELLKTRSAYFSRLMYLSYASFYVAFPVSLAAAFLGRSVLEMRRLIFGIMAIYFLGLFFYYMFPSLGPLFVTPELFKEIPNQWQGILWSGHMSIKTDPASFMASPFLGVAAFPSLHGAHALFLVMMAYRYHRRLFYVYVPWIILLSVATVYMGWHYAVDVIAGAAIAVLCFRLTEKSIIETSSELVCPVMKPDVL